MMPLAEEIQQIQPIIGPEPWRHTLDTLRTASRISFQNILFPTDFSPTANRALPYAVEIARRAQGKIHAVHVISPRVSPAASPEEWSQTVQEDEEFRERGKAELEHELQELPHELLFLKGEVWENLEQVMNEQHVDVIVTATHGRSGIGKSLMGSVAEKIIRQASCPVLIVGTGVASKHSHAAAAELNCILYATDFSPESIAAARYAISLARDHQAKLILLHTVGAEMPEEEGASLETLHSIVPWGAGLRYRPQFLMERGEPADTILRVAGTFHADLVVLGARKIETHLEAAIHFSNSIVHQVLAQARCPVLTMSI
jgi:nucleotide-binding universal stress UspA family protein